MPNPSFLEIFEAIYGESPLAGRLALYTTTLRAGTRHTSWCFNLPQADRLSLFYRRTRQQRFGVALQDLGRALAIARQLRSDVPEGSVRGCEASVVALPALWAEIPFGAGAPDLPPDLRQALSLLKAIRRRAPVVVSSRTRAGGAVHALWPLDEPWVFDLRDTGVADRAAAKALLGRLQFAIASLAAGSGWQIPATVELAADCPVPGSATGASVRTGPRAALEAFPIVAGDGRVNRRDFESLPEPPPPAEPRPWGDLLERASGAAGPARPSRDLRPIVSGCSWIRQLHAERATLTRKELEKAIELLLWCSLPGADGPRLVHALASGHPGYDPVAIDRLIAELSWAPARPATCRDLGALRRVSTRHCARCPHRGQIETPLDLAAEAPPAANDESSVETAAREAPPDAGPGKPAATPSGTRPRILITARQDQVNDQAIAALGAAGAVFEHAGALVEVVRGAGGEPAVHPVRAPRLQELLARHCAFLTAPAGSGQLREASPPGWTVRALMARGEWPQLPRLAGFEAGAAATPRPGGGLRRPDDAEAAGLLAGLGQLIDVLGGAATARRITAALAAEPGRFGDLAAALERRSPGLAPGDPAAATSLGYLLRALKGSVFGGRTLVAARRTRRGIAWAVRPAMSRPANDLEEAA